MKTKVATAGLALCLALVMGCEEAAKLPDSGSDTTVQVPSTIIGRVLVIHFNGEIIVGHPNCQASKHSPRTARLYFKNPSTVQGVRDDGTFNYPTVRWEYKRLSAGAGTIKVWWENGTFDEFRLRFTAADRGSFRNLHSAPWEDSCGRSKTEVTGEFEIEAPPGVRP